MYTDIDGYLVCVFLSTRLTQIFLIQVRTITRYHPSIYTDYPVAESYIMLSAVLPVDAIPVKDCLNLDTGALM